MAIVTVTVHGQILDLDGSTPAVGTITWKTLQELRDVVDNIVYEPAVFTATLDVNGEFTLVLPATDSPDITPVDWTYQVYISTTTWRQTDYYSLPTTLAPAVEFADLLPIQGGNGSDCTPDGTACAPLSIVAQVEALQTAVDDLSDEVADLSALVGTFAGDISDLQADVASLNTTVSALVGQVNTISPIVFANQADIAVLQGQVTTIQGQITTIQGQITTLQGQVATNTADIATINGQITTINGQIATINGQITTLQGQVATLQTDLATLSANTVLRNPVSGAVYVGNQVIGPQATGAVPWLSNSSNPIPYSPGDTNFDFIRIAAIDEFGNTVLVWTLNGNAEERNRPSSRTRVASRTFESAEVVGYSTGQFWQASSNPTLAANRKPYLGVWGTAAAKPGWAEATEVLSGLKGVSIGGDTTTAPFNTLSAFNYRGLKTTPGAPTGGSGPWSVGDVLLDSVGVVWRCTVAGTPGTWVGNAPGTSLAVTFTGNMGDAALINDGNVANTGQPYSATTTYSVVDNRVWLDGNIANNGGVSIPAQTTLFTVNAAHVPARWVQFTSRTSTNLAVRLTIKGATGVCVADQAMAAGATMNLDGFNWRKAV